MASRPKSGSPAANGKPPPHFGSGNVKSSVKQSPRIQAVSTPPSKRAPPTALIHSPASPSISGGSSASTISDRTDAATIKSKENVTVTVRFRPLSSREIQRGDEIAWYADGNETVRSEFNSSTAYIFDKVFGPATTTRGVYDVAAQQVVNGAMEGINGTVFAYGVTSSGKTHTMHGDQKSPGIIPLAVKDVFNIIQETPNREFLLRVSYLEIYNEVINDLLDTAGQNLRIREDAHGTYVEGIKEEVVLSPAHALSLIAAGEEHRHVGSNNINLMSSRSHTIFTMTVESSATGEGSREEEVTLSQLNLIDLAGSESSKAETTGLRRKEGSYINKSLLTLGTVIAKLTDGKSAHIPYRDSKLTRLLQSSLGGHGRVSLICTVTPASSSNEETHNTLKFAHRAKHVELQSAANKILDEKSLIKKYQKEILNLKLELDRLKKGMVDKPFFDPRLDDLAQLRQQMEAGQVKLQSRLEEEEQAKAALMGRIQRLTKLILVSTKSTVPALEERPQTTHRRRYSFGEEELAYLPDRRRVFSLEDEEYLDVDLPELSGDGKTEITSGEDTSKEEKKSKKRGMLAWFKPKKQDHTGSADAETPGTSPRPEENKGSARKPPRRRSDDFVDSFPEATQAGELFSAAPHGRRPPPTATTMADQMDLLREQVKMLSGEVAFCTSSLKRLSEQAAANPGDNEVEAQILRLKEEIRSKKQQMKVLEQRILGTPAPAAAPSLEISQKIMKLSNQLNEKNFELEIKSADNRILQEQLQSKNAENLELQNTINTLKQKLSAPTKKPSIDYSKKGHSFFDTIETSDWLNAGDLSKELRFVEEGGEPNGAVMHGFPPKILQKDFAAASQLQSQILSQANEVEKLKQERNRLLEEKKDHEVQNKKLTDEASYAKELATAAAVELKSLAEEVTKLSAQNTKLTNELLVSRALVAERADSDVKSTSRRPDQDLVEQLRRELAEIKQKVEEKEISEASLIRELEDGKQREADLENDLAAMWVLVAKVKKEKGLEEDMKEDARNESLTGDKNTVEDLKQQLADEQQRRADSERMLSQLKSDALEDLDLSALENLQNLHVEALTKLCQAKGKAQERLEKERERKRSMEERTLQRSQPDSIASIGVQHLLLEEERNGHVCKVCFEAPTAAVLLPCRHFCLCKSCAIACTECPLCRSGITDRIITFT